MFFREGENNLIKEGKTPMEEIIGKEDDDKLYQFLKCQLKSSNVKCS
jgi:hypothetical protein